MTVWYLFRRNLRMFFRDRMSVFFSLLSSFIIIGLYVLFLGDIFVKNMSGMGEGVRFMMDSWIMAGLLAVSSMTTTLGALGIMVEDNAKKISRDFLASPIRRTSLAAGYILSAVAVGLIMSLITLVLAEGYIVLYGGELLSLTALLQVLCVMVLAVLSSSAMVFLLAFSLKSTNAFATASTIIGTLIGFVTGIYVPIGQLPEGVQMIIKLFPVSHAGVLFRQIMMEEPLKQVFAGAPAGVEQTFRLTMGVEYQFGNTAVNPLASILVLAATSLVFYLLALLCILRKRK